MALADLYEGFIFDYGKVLVLDQTPSDRAQMASIIGVPVEAFEELYWNGRVDYDKGVLTGVEYWQGIAQAAGKTLGLQQIEQATEIDSTSWMHFDEPMWVFVEELKAAGKRVAVLSNMPKDLGETIKSRTQRFDGFHHVTLSYEVNSVKPEDAIYEVCLAGIGTDRRKTLFLDDKIANVQGAEMVGLDAIEFLDRDEVLRRLRG